MDDLLIISLDLFDDIDEILEFIKTLSSTLKIIALRDIPNLAEGTLLVKKGLKSYCPSNIDAATLTQVVQIVKDGNVWVYPQLMSYIIKQMNVSTHGG